MSLTGSVLPIVLVILLVGGLVATVLFWSRIRGPEWTRRGQRVALLIGNQLVAVALVGVLINDAGDFFSSWSDLFGQDHQRATEYSVGGGHQVVTPALSHVATTSFSTAAQRGDRGELSTATIHGAAAGLSAPVAVYEPPQYFQAAHASDRFPVVEVVDSGQGSSLDADSRSIATKYLQAVRANTARPAVLVIVGATGRDWSDACVSSDSGPQTTAFLDADLPNALTHAYRVQPVGWGVTGVDAGGYCAAKLALTDTDVFWAGASADAYFTPRGKDVLPAQNDLIQRLRSLPTPPARLLLLQTAQVGSDAATQTSTLRSLTHAPMQVSVPTSHPADAAAATEQALEWLTEHLPPVRAEWINAAP